MRKTNCKENLEFSKEISLNNKQARALQDALKSTRNSQVKKILLSGHLACQEATVWLERMLIRHQKKCDKCQS